MGEMLNIWSNNQSTPGIQETYSTYMCIYLLYIYLCNLHLLERLILKYIYYQENAFDTKRHVISVTSKLPTHSSLLLIWVAFTFTNVYFSIFLLHLASLQLPENSAELSQIKRTTVTNRNEITVTVLLEYN